MKTIFLVDRGREEGKRERGRLLLTDAYPNIFLHGLLRVLETELGLTCGYDISSLFQWVTCRFHATTFCAASIPLGLGKTSTLKGN